MVWGFWMMNKLEIGGVMKKILKLIVIILLVIIGICVIAYCGFVFYEKFIVPNGSNKYYKKVSTGGEIEAKYIEVGPYGVSYFEQTVLQNYKKYEVYYPTEMEDSNKKYPVIVSNNGTEVKASTYKEWFKHMASYGFIVVGNEEEYSWNGFSADMSINYLLKLNEMEDSIFYKHIDIDNIGVVGYSQGGAGTINTITDTKSKDVFKTAVALSPTMENLASNMEWYYDASKVNIPILLLASTGNTDEKLVVNLQGLEGIYNKISDSQLKIMARRNDCDHKNMLVYADGYVTAWFMWQLQGDEIASKAFIEDKPEIKNNKLYQDIEIND